MTVLVTGGAGYIGSHTVKLLLQQGYQPVIYDNLVYGHRGALRKSAFVQGDLHDTVRLIQVLQHYHITDVIHFAAFAYVGESVQDPLKYYNNNVVGTLSLLQAMRVVGVQHLIFSSTCAVYGNPQTSVLREDHPFGPINPYGESKLFVERMLQSCATAYGLRWISLRYFNAAGADPEGELGESHDPETHLIPLVLSVASGRRADVAIFGTDYETADGSCVRDYIHVTDLADAHIRALHVLDTDKAQTAYNLGNGTGYSVYQVIDTARHVTGRPIATSVAPRRPGDPPCLVAAADKVRTALGWQPRYPDLHTIVETAWRWECQRRYG